MKNISKILVFILAATVLFSACGNSGTPLLEMDAAELENLIIIPLASANALEVSWDTPERLDPDTLVEIYYYTHGNNDLVKEKDLEQWVESHLGVTAERIRLSSYYSSEDKGYLLEHLSLRQVSVSNTIVSLVNTNPVLEFDITEDGTPIGTGLLFLQGDTSENFKTTSFTFTPVETPKTEESLQDDDSSPHEIDDEPANPDMTINESQPPTEDITDVPPVNLTDDGDVIVNSPTPDVQTDQLPDDFPFDFDPDAPLGSAQNPIAEEPIAD